ncbi:hypothetical protein GCM10028806_26430 [Spirosoma terrae]|uniref:Uncharacterized protein n=1 Tax=Spirosoma terrae TaxID=1968276 RepID=A0A6L9L9K2_9BACT|nr:hypothetical protein [Spirosoma terrae]NDU97110.1 hypothetical protein [Spirosoma terrae]
MQIASKGVIYSLLTAVVVLLVGIAALVSVANYRHQRLEDATQDLRRNLTQQQGQIKNLQQQLEDCDTIKTVPPVDTSWGSPSAVDSTQAISHNW